MNQLKKKLQTCERQIKARVNYLKWQEMQLKRTLKEKITSPQGLAVLCLISFFSIFSYRKKMISVVGNLTKRQPLLPFFLFFWRMYLLKKLPIVSLLTQFKRAYVLKVSQKYFRRILASLKKSGYSA